MAVSFARIVSTYASDYFKQLNLTDFIPKYGFEEVRIKKYDADCNCRFDPHVDVSNADSAKRFLIFILYLNDHEGGHTTFTALNKSVKPKAGRLLCFPPTW